jgi:predicted ribosomally synthesized peptide with nif11-like leader
MATKAVTAFLGTLAMNSELRAQVENATTRDKESWAAEICEIAATAGFSIQPNEILAAVQDEVKRGRPLSDDELEDVSAGANAPITRYYLENAWPAKWR